MSTFPIALQADLKIRVAPMGFTHAQILTLPTTPRIVVPAPGAGKLINLINAVVTIDVRAGVYSVGLADITIAKLQIGISNPRVYQIGNAEPQVTDDSKIWVNQIPGDLAAKVAIERMENIPLYFWITSYTDPDEEVPVNFTGGHASNTITVTALYSIVDI